MLSFSTVKKGENTLTSQLKNVRVYLKSYSLIFQSSKLYHYLILLNHCKSLLLALNT